MKQISSWAWQHKKAARALIIVSYLLLNAMGFAVGSTTGPLPSWLSWLVLVPFLVALVLYPSKNQKNRYVNFYRARKTADLVMVTASFLLIVSAGSRYDVVQPHVSQQAAIASMQAPAVKKPGGKKFSIHLGSKGFFARHWKKIKTGVQEIRTALRQPGGAGKAALVILTILGALLLLYIVAAISCSVACSGAEGLAFTIALLGTAGVVFLTVVVIRRIMNRPKKTPEPEITLD
jgi:hypothetical protein